MPLLFRVLTSKEADIRCRAEKAYLAAGFKREGVLRDAIWNGKEYADDILMALLEDEWRKLKGIEKIEVE